ncbi:hypothetical protein ABC347_09475 [Sphingomonas sp. 1P06PA]|uniref:hypothetical protein n=1 Tax=Sphingomonas sp. 1P06PA TaxID=554121 RepID=UPI0039A4C831
MQHRNILSGDPLDPRCERVVRTMATGGDARITLDPESGLNRYLCAPRPSPALAYASSTANDLSIDAFDHVLSNIDVAMSYGAALDVIRDRIRAAYDLRSDTSIVIAPSGTDLEYVGLAVARDRAPGGILNILLGADEVGSGCVNSAHGRFFAEQTALGISTVPGTPVAGIGLVELTDIAVRDQQGRARRSGEIADHIDAAATTAAARGLHTVVHVVHGSKTGLVLPEPEDLDGLIARHGDTITIVVDACQARITPGAIAFYLARGAIVLLTGSKFMGGPPFSGFALVPAGTPMPTLPPASHTYLHGPNGLWFGRDATCCRTGPIPASGSGCRPRSTNWNGFANYRCRPSDP